MMRNVLAGLAACAVASLLVGGCGSSDGGDPGTPATSSKASGGTSGSGPIVTDGTFTLAIGGDIGGFDPAVNLSSTASGIYPFVYDTLVAPDENNKIVGNLAESWTVKPRLVTLKIREGVTCSDGSPVTASVVAQNLEHLKSPKVGYPALGTLAYTVDADDAANTVAIRFSEPAPFPLQNMVQIQIVCGKGLKDRGALSDAPSGSGPYVLEEAVPNDHYRLTLREGYTWGPDGATTAERGMPQTLVVRVVPNQTTISNLLLADELTASVVTGAEAVRLRSAGVPNVPLGLGVKLTYFNEGKGHPTSDPAVRKALLMGLDRKSVATAARAREATSLMAPPLNPCPDSSTGASIPKHDVAGAGALLDEAGWAKGADGMRAKNGTPLRVTLLGDTGEGQTISAANELIAQEWRKLGVDAQAKNMAEGPGLQVMASGGWDVFALFPVVVPSPAQFAPLAMGPAPPKGSNFGRIENAEYDRLVAEAMAAEDEAAVCEAWNAAEQALIEGADVVPLILTETNWFVTKKADLQLSGRGPIPTSIRMHQG
jgi:peptide/nickel transport system substrate-binding protein